MKGRFRPHEFGNRPDALVRKPVNVPYVPVTCAVPRRDGTGKGDGLSGKDILAALDVRQGTPVPDHVMIPPDLFDIPRLAFSPSHVDIDFLHGRSRSGLDRIPESAAGDRPALEDGGLRAERIRAGFAKRTGLRPFSTLKATQGFHSHARDRLELHFVESLELQWTFERADG